MLRVPLCGVGARGAARAGRQHAVEHVDPAPDRLHDVVGRAHAHQVARPLRRQRALEPVEHRQHLGLAFAHREPAHGVAVEADLHERRRRFCPQRREDAALDDAEQPVAGPLHERLPAARGPAHGAAHRLRGLLLAHRIGRALVQHHGDIAVQRMLDVHGARRRQMMAGAVGVRTEHDAILLHGAELGERHHLEAAGIGEDRPRPVHEFVQAAEAGDALSAGTDHQVIGVAEHDLGAARPHRIDREPLDRRLGSHGHEGGRVHGPWAVSSRPSLARPSVASTVKPRLTLRPLARAGRRRRRSRSDSLRPAPPRRRPSSARCRRRRRPA